MKKNIKKFIQTPGFPIGVLLLYAALTLSGLFLHENRMDETQAWCIVRDNDIIGIFDALRSEGHPPLWYMILYPVVKLNLPIISMALISWAFSFVSAALIMYKSPFGIIMKTIIVFSGGFIYHLSIVSRSYSLIILILCLIAIIYPDRKKHPLIFGLLVGLLAITHVIMCGLVGIIGIYMLIDLFKDWRKNKTVKNILNLSGLLIAGMGVLLLVLPLRMSMESNYNISDDPLTWEVLPERLYNCFVCVGKYLVKLRQISSLDWIAGVFTSAVIIAALFMMRRYPKALISTLVFSFFFFLTTQLIYTFFIPPRAFIYVYTLIIIYWSAKNSSDPISCDLKIDDDKLSSPLLKKLIGVFINIDKKYERSIKAIFCLLCIMSYPSGYMTLIRDYGSSLSAAKALTAFVRENIRTDESVFIVMNRSSVYSAEMPELKLYDPFFNRYVTYDYNDLDEATRIANNKGPHEELKAYKHIYQITESNIYYNEKKSEKQIVKHDVIFENDFKGEFFDYYCHVELFELTQAEKDALIKSE